MDWGCNDFVRRSDVLEITAETGAVETQGRVKELPAADVLPLASGKWVKVVHAIAVTTANCSECGCEAVWRSRTKPYTLCPNCGAFMDDETAIS